MLEATKSSPLLTSHKRGYDGLKLGWANFVFRIVTLRIIIRQTAPAQHVSVLKPWRRDAMFGRHLILKGSAIGGNGNCDMTCVKYYFRLDIGAHASQ